MNVLPQAMTQMMDQRINSVAYFKLLSELMKFLLSVSPSKLARDKDDQWVRFTPRSKTFFFFASVTSVGVLWVDLAL